MCKWIDKPEHGLINCWRICKSAQFINVLASFGCTQISMPNFCPATFPLVSCVRLCFVLFLQCLFPGVLWKRMDVFQHFNTCYIKVESVIMTQHDASFFSVKVRALLFLLTILLHCLGPYNTNLVVVGLGNDSVYTGKSCMDLSDCVWI